MRQYRPVLEAFSWEVPAGLVDPGETPADACRRELLEETGLTARAIHPLGENSPCTGRLGNRIHSFFVEAGERIKGFKPEAGITVKLVSPAEVVRLITSGGFDFPTPSRRAALGGTSWLSGSAEDRAGCTSCHDTRKTWPKIDHNYASCHMRSARALHQWVARHPKAKIHQPKNCIGPEAMPCSARYCASSASVYMPRRRALLPRPTITAIAIRPFAKWWIMQAPK